MQMGFDFPTEAFGADYSRAAGAWLPIARTAVEFLSGPRQRVEFVLSRRAMGPESRAANRPPCRWRSTAGALPRGHGCCAAWPLEPYPLAAGRNPPLTPGRFADAKPPKPGRRGSAAQMYAGWVNPLARACRCALSSGPAGRGALAARRF